MAFCFPLSSNIAHGHTREEENVVIAGSVFDWFMWSSKGLYSLILHQTNPLGAHGASVMAFSSATHTHIACAFVDIDKCTVRLGKSSEVDDRRHSIDLQSCHSNRTDDIPFPSVGYNVYSMLIYLSRGCGSTCTPITPSLSTLHFARELLLGFDIFDCSGWH